MGIALSINGTLVAGYGSMESVADLRSASYTQIAVGQPIVVRYLRFRLAHAGFEHWQRQQLMISTYLKTSEKKTSEAEAVTFFDPETRFTEGVFELEDFGAHRYGHPLCYYSKAYAGEAIRMTTRVMELDKRDIIRALGHVLESAAGVPVFTAFLPYAATASAGLTIIGKIIDWLSKDTTVVPPIPLDLEFDVPNARALQSGRYVLATNINDADLVDNYHLDPMNRLRTIAGDREYAQGSYWVLQVNSSDEPRYEQFDAFAQAAELLARTNRPQSVTKLAEDLADVIIAAADVRLVRKIEDLRFDDKTDEIRARINAYFKLMTPTMKELYEQRIRDILRTPNIG